LKVSQKLKKTKLVIWVSGKELQEATGISPADLNDAVKILVDKEMVEEAPPVLGTAPYNFSRVTITSKGRFSLE
jgi:hypothetical protein